MAQVAEAGLLMSVGEGRAPSSSLRALTHAFQMTSASAFNALLILGEGYCWVRRLCLK